MTVPTMKVVTRDEYLAYIAQFPSRMSYRTGICEPPQEHCVLRAEGDTDERGWIDRATMIGRIVLNEAMRGFPGTTEKDWINRYQIRDEAAS